MRVFLANYDADTDISRMLKTILDKYYTSGVDRVLSYGKSSATDNVVGEFIADGSQFYFSIDPNKGTVSYSPVGVKEVTDSAFVNSENRQRLLLINPSIENPNLKKSSFVENYLDSLFKINLDAAQPKTGAKTVANKSGKTLTCTPGKTYPCGAVCRAMGKPCKGLPMSDDIKKMANAVAAAIPTAKKKPTETSEATPPPKNTPAKKPNNLDTIDIDSFGALPNKNTPEYYKQINDVIKNGKISEDTKKDIQAYMDWMHSYSGEVKTYGSSENSKKAVAAKQKRIVDEMDTKDPDAALGLACYLHGHPFGKMNGVLWRKDIDSLDNSISDQEGRSKDEFTKQYIALDVGAAKTLRELPKLSDDALRERYKDHDIETGTFRRYMTLPEGDVLSNFLKEHKAGDTIAYHSFTSCTVFSKEDATPNIAQFSKSANVKYTVTRKKDTEAKAVDHFKNKAVEGEVLYPPGTKFKVVGVEEEKVEKVARFPFASISKSKKEQKKLNAFVEKIPKENWDGFISRFSSDKKLKRLLTGIRNKDEYAFGISMSFYVGQKSNAHNSLYDLFEKAGVKIDKEGGASRYHIRLEEV